MLSSDVLEDQFGPTRVEVLYQDAKTRIITTKIMATQQSLELSWVSFDAKGVAIYPGIHATIVGGQSIGKAFKVAGTEFVRETRTVSKQQLPAVFERWFEDDGLATVIEVLVLVGPQQIPYARILETYSPAVKWPQTATAQRAKPAVTKQFAELLDALPAAGGATVYLALGSNVGDSEQNITSAIDQLRSSLSGIKQAPLYRSKAVGYTDQPDFVNTAIQGTTSLSPSELLAFVKNIEKKVGRIKRFRWGPREIDIDIIFYGDTLVNQPGLTIPHPRFAERDFVLQPLSDLNPQLVDPTSKLTISQLYKKLPNAALSIKG